MTLRTPAVAGHFYPADPEALGQSLARMTVAAAPERRPALGVVVPHAGYIYSGQIAGEVYASVALPSRVIVLGPNHTGMGRPLAIVADGAWQTPLGRVAVDTELARALQEADPELEPDDEAHRMEHAIEVQLPFLQHLGGDAIQFVPVVVGTTDRARLQRLGEALAEAIETIDEPVLIIASSDMNHYEPDAPTRVKDRKAIDRILARDAFGLYDVVLDEDISMCGFAPTVAMLRAVNRLGARRAELIRYGTSGDVSGDLDRVVGYAGIVVS